MGLLLAATAAAVGALAYRSFERTQLPIELANALADARVRADVWTTAIRDARAQVRVLASSASAEGVARARLAGGRDPIDGVGEEVWKSRLAHNFQAAFAESPNLLQLRLIEAASGLELVRVERTADGRVRRTAEQDLQDKSGRGYVKSALALGPGQTEVSGIELNREHGRVSEPHIPVLRIATPVVDGSGRRFGLLVLNLDVRSLLDRLREPGHPGGAVYAISQVGDFVIHPEREREFGTELGRPVDWRAELPAVADALSERDEATVDLGDTLRGAAMRVRLGEQSQLIVVDARPGPAVLALPSLRRSVGVAALAAAAVGLGLALALTRAVTSPLEQLTRAMRAFPRGAPESIPTDAPGEIGVLARTFRQMLDETHERAETLRRTRERERLHVALVDSSHDAIVATDADGMITVWNSGAERLFGYTAEEMIGRTTDRLVPASRRGEVEAILRDIAAGKAVALVETERVRRDGERVEVSLSASPVYDEAGEITGQAGILRDLDERRLAERQLAQALESSPHGMAIVDEVGRILQHNSALERMFGYETRALRGCAVENLVPEGARAGHSEARAKYMSSPTARAMGVGRDLLGLRADGSEFPVEVGLAPMPGSGELRILVTVVDITERKRAERALAAYARRLEESNTDLSQFASVVSHDLKAPLRGITSLADWIGEDLGEVADPETRDNLALLQERSRRLGRMIDGILAYSRVARADLNPESVDARAVVEEVLAAFPCPAGFEVELSGAWQRVTCDETQLRQVFQNLISNAYEHHGGSRGRVEISSRAEADATWFEVADDGVGISERHRERIFRLFETLRPAEQSSSTGIGLSIVKRIVQRLGGEIRVDAREGGGTRMAFSIPRAAPVPPSHTQQERSDGY